MAKKKPTKQGQLAWLLGRISASERRGLEMQPGVTKAELKLAKKIQRGRREIFLSLLSPEAAEPHRGS